MHEWDFWLRALLLPPVCVCACVSACVLSVYFVYVCVLSVCLVCVCA